jgi:hypothetical protein
LGAVSLDDPRFREWLKKQRRFDGHFYVECLRRGVAPPAKFLDESMVLQRSMPPLLWSELLDLRSTCGLFMAHLTAGDT